MYSLWYFLEIGIKTCIMKLRAEKAILYYIKTLLLYSCIL